MAPDALLPSSKSLFHGCGDDFANAFAQRWHVFFRESLGLDGVVKMHRNLRPPEHPVARPVMLKGAHQTDGYDRNTELLRDAKAAVLKFIHSPVARPPGFRKNNQAGAAVDGVLREPPHALQVRRPPDIRNGDVAEALHQPAVRGNLEVRFQLPSADKLRDGAVEQERIEKIDVVDEEKARPAGVEPRGTDGFYSRPRQKGDASAETALQPIVFAGIQKNPQQYEHWHHQEEMQAAENPQNRAADRKPGLLHRKTSTAAGTTSSERHSSVATSPSIM